MQQLPTSRSLTPLETSVNGVEEKTPRKVACTKCARDFLSKAELHEHVFECAIKSEVDEADADEVNEDEDNQDGSLADVYRSRDPYDDPLHEPWF